MSEGSNRTNCMKCGGLLKDEDKDDPEIVEHDDCNPTHGSKSRLERMIEKDKSIVDGGE